MDARIIVCTVLLVIAAVLMTGYAIYLEREFYKLACNYGELLVLVKRRDEEIAGLRRQLDRETDPLSAYKQWAEGKDEE